MNSVANKLFLRSHIEDAFDTSMTCGEDMCFCMQYLQRCSRVCLVGTCGYYYYKPEINSSVKYVGNDAVQCAKYSDSVKQFLQQFQSLDEQNQAKLFEFICGNVCRDVGMIAKAFPSKLAKAQIIEFYNQSVLVEAMNSGAWKRLGTSYKAVGFLFQKRMISAIITSAKLK